MKTKLSGQALVLGNNIDTDQIFPGRYLALVDPQEIGRLCLSGVSSDIAENFPLGGIVVAGRNFGCGSSREHAAIALLSMGASVVLAESFARIFYRNAINLGLPLMEVRDISSIVHSGETLSVDLKGGQIKNIDTGQILRGEKIPDHALAILSAGGIKKKLKETSK